MIHALTKQIAAEGKDLFKCDEVFVSLHETEEFMNIAKRQIEMQSLPDSSAVFKIFNKPMLFLRLMDVRYDDGRSGYRRAQTGYTFLASLQKYLSLKVITVIVGYDLRLYSLFAKQAFDLISLFMFMNRSTEVQAIINDQIAIRIPISMLVTEIYESVFDFVLSGKGVKVYKVGGRLETLGYMFPVNISGAQGEEDYLTYWDSTRVKNILYDPVKKIRIRYIEGDEIIDEPKNWEEQMLSV